MHGAEEPADGVEFAVQDRGADVVDGLRTLPLDPSVTPGTRTGAEGGLRPHLAVRHRGRLETPPEPPAFAGARFATVEAALADGPKYFEDLMAAVGSRDGRNVVLALEPLRTAGTLGRDAGGRYVIKN